MKKCPYCAEVIQDEAKICRHCKRRVKRLLSIGQIITLAVLGILILTVVAYGARIKKFVTDLSQKSQRFVHDTKEVGDFLANDLERRMSKVAEKSQDFLNEVHDARRVINELPENIREYQDSVKSAGEDDEPVREDTGRSHRPEPRIKIEVSDE